MNYDFTNVELHDAYMEGDDLWIVCYIDDIYFKRSFGKKELKKFPDDKMDLGVGLETLRELFKKSGTRNNMLGTLTKYWMDSSGEDHFFFGPFMKKAENYTLVARDLCEGLMLLLFTNNFNRRFTIAVEIPLEFEHLPVDDPRIQHLLQEELDNRGGPLFETPEIKGLKADK
jgi:hypothetical protein